jgi:hypothetical protein
MVRKHGMSTRTSRETASTRGAAGESAALENLRNSNLVQPRTERGPNSQLLDSCPYLMHYNRS